MLLRIFSCGGSALKGLCLTKTAFLGTASLALALTIMPTISWAEAPPLLSKAKSVFERAARSAVAEIRKNGIAGLNGKLQDCYDRSMIRRDLSRVQYCFAMHIAAIQHDRAVIALLGGEGSSSGMDLADAYEMAAPTLRRVGYESSDEILSVLQAWIDIFMKD